VLGWLLVCEPPEQTMQELAERLHASMGSISTMTRLLDQLGLIERTSVPGERRVRYRIRPDAWTRSVEEVVEHARSFEVIADKGLALMAKVDPARRQRLEAMQEWSRFYGEELRRLISKWEDHYQAFQSRRR
jgi:DNA-binding transcriptional regulator GbsR (MarR family)